MPASLISAIEAPCCSRASISGRTFWALCSWYDHSLALIAKRSISFPLVRVSSHRTAEAEASKSDLKELVKKFIPEAIGKDIEKACQGIYPLQTVFIRKVKTLKQPRFDLIKLKEMHGDATGEDAGKVLAAAPMSALVWGFAAPGTLVTVALDAGAVEAAHAHGVLVRLRFFLCLIGLGTTLHLHLPSGRLHVR